MKITLCTALVLYSLNSTNFDFLNQICYFSIKELHYCPLKAEWTPFQT